MSKISEKVQSQLRGTGDRATIIVSLVNALEPAAAPEGSRAEKAQQVRDAKNANMEASQHEIKALLDGKHIPFKSFWINNSVAVEADWTLAEEIALLPSVLRIEPNDGGAQILE